MSNPVVGSVLIEPVSPSDVVSVATKLKPNLSCGHDNISTKLLKLSIEHIIEPITHVVNRSFDTGIIPKQMKIAKVIIIHKSSDHSLLDNHRPISLLPAFPKLIEKLMYNKISSFFIAKNLFYKHQYGFQNKHYASSSPLFESLPTQSQIILLTCLLLSFVTYLILSIFLTITYYYEN